MRYFLDALPGLALILVRHAHTALNEQATPMLRGWQDDELSPEGRLTAQFTAEKLRQYDPKYIVSSDFMRDTQTANIIAERLHISDIEADWNARTWDTGTFSGQVEAEVNPAIMAIYQQPWQSAPGGSESMNDFYARWEKLLDRKLEMIAGDHNKRPALIVTHGRNIAATESYLEGTIPWQCEMPDPGGFALISVGDDRSLRFTIVPPTQKITEDV